MAKFKINPELVKILLPVVIPIARDLAAKTETKVDDKLVAALEAALANPMVLAFLLSLLAGEEEVKPALLSAEESEAMDTISENAEVVGAIFSLAKVD
jgi:hypothetical protein